jgi:acyl-CoA thioesterase I
MRQSMAVYVGALLAACGSRAGGSPSSGLDAARTTCEAGYADCDGNDANGCETNLQTSVNDCGACGNVCTSVAHGAAACASGGCTITCDAGYTFSAGACVVTQPPSSAASMPRISTGKPAYASEGTASLLTDGAYRWPYAWTFTPSDCTASSPCWGAVKVGAGPAKLLVSWTYQDGNGAFDTTVWGGDTVTAYSLLVSSDSANGADGTWTTATDALTGAPVVVTGNTYIDRVHLIDFAGWSWVKLAITASTANEVDELEAWDASSTSDDTYFFHGDSITERCANTHGTAPAYGQQPSFQADVQAMHPTNYPVQIGGGIVSQGAADAAREIVAYLPPFRPVKYWFLTMGTNDLCGGAASYSGYAQRWVEAVKAAGATPILVHPIWANDDSSYCSWNGPAFNAAVDALVTSNALPPAVPLYEATLDHPEYFDTGDVHPNASGCHAWNQTFATYVNGFYP